MKITIKPDKYLKQILRHKRGDNDGLRTKVAESENQA